jgi:hypothetical protein
LESNPGSARQGEQNRNSCPIWYQQQFEKPRLVRGFFFAGSRSDSPAKMLGGFMTSLAKKHAGL